MCGLLGKPPVVSIKAICATLVASEVTLYEVGEEIFFFFFLNVIFILFYFWYIKSQDDF